MPTENDSIQNSAKDADVGFIEVLTRMRELPEALALEIYSQLNPRLQWLARQMMSGSRRRALIVHHLRTNGRSG
jgi:ribosomal protein S4